MSDPALPQNQWGNWTLQFGLPVKQARYDIYKVGQIAKVLKFPCSPSPAIYLETLGPALLNAIVSFVEPDAKELYKWGHEGAPKGKNGRSLGKNVKSIVSAFKQLSPDFEDGAGKYLFNFLEFADTAAWYVFILSLVEDAIFEWVSMAWKKAGCTNGHAFQLVSPTPTGPVQGATPGQLNIIDWNGYRNGLYGTWPSQMIVPSGASWSAGGTMQVNPWIAQPNCNYRIGVQNLTTGETIATSDFMGSSPPGNKAPIVFNHSQPPANGDQEIIVGIETDIPFAWEYAPTSGYLNMTYEFA